MHPGRQYKLLRELASGSFGTVYLAEMMSAGDFKKRVALKVLHPIWAQHPDAASRFRDEARMLGQLRHRHIVQVDGLVTIGGRWAVVMEYVAGADSNVVINACRKAQHSLPIPAALEIAAAVAAALDAAYNAPGYDGVPLRVIHRDIKPSNIRLTADGDVKVLDFGIAQAEFQGREAATQSIRYGSVRYMAPERRAVASATGEPRWNADSPAGDVYGLGCVLFELVLGGPFGNAEPVRKDHDKRVAARLAIGHRRLGESGREVLALIEEMLQYEPADRPSAEAVSERARQLARRLPGDDLPTFTARFLPEVPRYVDDGGVEMHRLVQVSEDTDPLAPGTSLVEEPSAPEPTASAVTRAASMRRWGLAVGGIAAVAVAAVGARLVAGAGPAAVARSTVVPTALPNAGAAPVPAAEPAVEPPPAEAPPAATAEVPVPVDEPVAVAPATHDTTGATQAKVERTDVAEKPRAAHAATPTPSAAEVTSTERIRSFKVVVVGATDVSADCVGTRAVGSTYLVVRDLAPGPCTLRATIGDRAYVTTVDVRRASGVECEPQGNALACR